MIPHRCECGTTVTDHEDLMWHYMYGRHVRRMMAKLDAAVNKGRYL